MKFDLINYTITVVDFLVIFIVVFGIEYTPLV